MRCIYRFRAEKRGGQNRKKTVSIKTESMIVTMTVITNNIKCDVGS